MSMEPLAPLREGLVDLGGFKTLADYRLFGAALLRYIRDEEPTEIFSPSDERYCFYQFANRQITRPLNFDLWIEEPDTFEEAFDRAIEVVVEASKRGGLERASKAHRAYAASQEIRRVLYTAQQAI